MKTNISGITKLAILSFFCLLGLISYSQKITSFEVTLEKPTYGLNIPVSLDLTGLTTVSDTNLSLYELKGNTRTAVPFQVEQGDHRRIFWMVKTGNEPGGKHRYELVRAKSVQPQNVRAISKDGSLTIQSGDKKLLRYQFQTLYPPKGIDTAYKRSGFIHPLWSPHGQELTRIQPRDHYHHYGIWNPWTHVLFEGDTIDFWNLYLKQGTVRFADLVSVVDGALFSQFEVLHKHVAFKKDASEKVALNELQRIRVYQLEDDQDNYLVDFYIQLNCAGDSPVKLLEYRYAGLGWRTTGKWDNKNSMVLTSEGKNRKEADGSKARWCIVQGAMDDDYAGAEMMSYPTNYNYPEPLRIWPENQNNRGDLFANFCPTKDRDWLLEPGQNYILKYRFLVFNNKLTGDKAESAWYYFANPPKVTIK